MSDFSAKFHSYDTLDFSTPSFRPPGADSLSSYTSNSTPLAEAEHLKSVFTEHSVKGIDQATWHPSAPIQSQVLANLPITHHYLTDPRQESYDCLHQELMFGECGMRGPGHKSPKFKLGLAALMRYYSPGANNAGYQATCDDPTWDRINETWQFIGTLITKPGMAEGSDTGGGNKRATKDDAVVAANVALTMDIWAFQSFTPELDWRSNSTSVHPDSQPNAPGSKLGEHLFICWRRVRDPDVSVVTSGQKRQRVEGQERFHWEPVPVSCTSSLPPYYTYNSDPRGRDTAGWHEWHGGFWHIGTYQLTTMRANNSTGKNFPALARDYLYAKDGVRAFGAYQQLRKIEICVKRT